jgi:hypothetical protein
MKSKYLYILGGISAFTVVVLILSDMFGLIEDDYQGYWSQLSRVVYYLYSMLPFLVILALYRLFVAKDRKLSLASLIISLLGVVIFYVFTKNIFDLPTFVFSISSSMISDIPALIFGILAYRQSQTGISHPLAIMSILYGSISIIFNFIWNLFPDLNFGFVDYLPLTLYFIWLIWMGFTIIFGKLDEPSDKLLSKQV